MYADVDVIVVGAGPVGLTLAAELRLAGARPLVVERLTAPSPERKARGIGPLAAEALRRRGLGERLMAHDADGRADLQRDHGSDKGHFAWIHKIDPALQEEPDRRGVLIWQPRLESLLAEHADGLGVPVLRGTALTALAQDGDGVTATVRGPDGERTLRAAYLVGCDGGHSTVRRLADFDFPGTPPVMVAYRATVDLDGREKLPPPGRTPTGALFHGPDSVGVFEFDGERPEERQAPVTRATLQAALRRVSGTDVTVTALHDAMRFTDHARQAADYRSGRVLLAGDAAHVHSANGGQGLNLGLTDAVNLGWKLAAAVRGDAPAGLLDTYTAERHPVGAAVLQNTRAQTALLRPGPHVDALRDIVSELMELEEVNRYFGRMLSGLGTRYAFPYATADTHPLVGTHCPDLRLTVTAPGEPGEVGGIGEVGGVGEAVGTGKAVGTGEAGKAGEIGKAGEPVRLGDVARGGRFVLLAPAGDPAPARTAAPWRNRLETVTVTSTGHDALAAALIRPDGAIAWAAGPGDDPDVHALETALRTWLA